MTSQHPLDLLVRNLAMRTPLPESDQAAILGLPYTLQMMEPANYLAREGEQPSRCGVLVTGFAYRQKITRTGARQIISIHIPGDAVDFQNLYLDVADHSVQLLTRSKIAFVPREALQELVRNNPRIGTAIFVNSLIEASIFREWVVNVGRRMARERVAHLLCELGARLDAMGLADEYGYNLPMTQEELADAVGLTPVHVSRTLKDLAADGLIVRNKRSIAFPDWGAIREAGDFYDRYLHLSSQHMAA